MGRVVPLVLVFAASGCEIVDGLGDPAGAGKVDVEVETRDGVPVISWDRDDAWLVGVAECKDECECRKGSPVFDAFYIWTIQAEEYDVFGDETDAEPPFQSPVAYGDEDVPGDVLHETAMPLEPGRTYGVQVVAGKWTGCTTFVMDE